MRLLKYTMILGISCFFAVMWGLIIRQNLSLEHTAAPQVGYDRLLSDDEDKRQSQYDIYLGERRIGETRSFVEREPGGLIFLETETTFHLGSASDLLNIDKEHVDILFTATVSPLQGLQSIRIMSKSLGIQCVGMVRDERIVLQGSFGGKKISTEVPYASHSIVLEPFTPLQGLSNLREADIGEAWNMHLVNPLTGGVDSVTLTLMDERVVWLEGSEMRLYLLTLQTRSSIWKTWVTSEGEVLYQGTPVGIFLKREPMHPELWQVIRNSRQ